MKKTKKTPKTELITGKQGENELQVPIIDLKTGSQQFTSQKESLRNTLLSQLFTPEELKKLAIVKTDDKKTVEEATKELESLEFPDSVERFETFGSGSNVYYTDKKMKEKLQRFFKTDSETAFRYGSLLTSSCLTGVKTFDAHANDDTKPLRIKIVDSESSDPEQLEVARQFQTGDCHGKISPSLAKQLNASPNCPFQFRMAWMKDWATQDSKTPNADFLAKGTFLPDKAQTDDKGYDLILDRSSIKGVNKKKLDRLIPCGDFELSKVVIGNRSNAKVQKYENSWQLLQWCSEDTLRKDIVPETSKAAKKLASIQDNPFALRNYIIEQHDRQKEILAAKEEENSLNEEGNSSEEKQERSESRLISLLRADRHGQLLDHPKMASFMRDQVARRWTNLAIKGAINHGSAMAQPCDELKKGTIVAPHLKNGTEVMVTRYPIISKDNIRRYTVDNEQKPELKKYKGCAFIRPDQAMEHHQCDFDGDQLVITPTSIMPNMASEFRHANDPEKDFKPVVKRPKVPYTKSCDSMGEIAVAIGRNDIGKIATAIGRVQTSVNDNPDTQPIFDKKKGKLLDSLFDALQIEVDSPKSATRYKAYHPKLKDRIDAWKDKHPSYLFDFKKDDRLYKSMPLPAEGKNPINVIAREAVNPEWQETQINSRQRHEFRYLMPSHEKLGVDKETWDTFCEWAREIKEDYIQGVRQIKQANGDNSQANKEGIGKLYDNIRADIDETFRNKPEYKELATSAMWNIETTDPNLNVPRKICCEESQKLKPTFKLAKGFQRLHSALPEDTYILSVPFKRKGKDENGKQITKDRATIWKNLLDREKIEYEATLHPSLPMVNFALIDPPDGIIKQLDEKFGNNRNNPDRLNLSYTNHKGQERDVSNRIVPPREYTWVESEEDYNPKASLVVNLFTEEIGQQLDEDDYLSKLELVGQKYNEFAGVDLHSPKSEYKDKTLTFEVGKIPESAGKQRKGTPIVMLEGKQLAMFSANSPKLPPGTTFTGAIAPGKSESSLNLMIDPESIQHLDAVSQQEKSSQKSATVTQTPDTKTKSTKPKTRRRSSTEAPATEASTPETPTAGTTVAQTPAEQPVNDIDANDALFKIIKGRHENTGEIAFDIGDWRTLVNDNKSFIVKTRDRKNRRILFKGNLETGKITRELNSEDQKRFIEIKDSESENLPSIKETESSDRSLKQSPDRSDRENELHNDFLQLIKEHHEQTGKNQFQIMDSDWNVLIDKNTSAFQVKSQNKKFICLGHLNSGKCTRKMSPENQKKLVLMARQYADEHNIDTTQNGNMKKKKENLQA